MARSFNGSSDYLSVAAAPVTGPPVTIAGWFRSSSTASIQRLMCINDPGATLGAAVVGGILLNYPSAGSVTGQTYTPNGLGGYTNSLPAASGSYSVDTWTHAAFVVSDLSNRTIYRDGGNSASDATTATSVTPTTIMAGAVQAPTLAEYLSGAMAEWGIWNAALSSAEVALLAAGVSPLLVRPGALIGYWPMIGRYSPEIDLRRANGLALTGTSTADHPRIIYPQALLVPGMEVAAAASGATRIIPGIITGGNLVGGALVR